MFANLIWATPAACQPPHTVGRPEQVDSLMTMFVESGWDHTKPALVGYRFNGTIQLLSGSHRWAAAHRVKLAIPVVVWNYQDIELAWGDLDKWRVIMGSGENIST